MKRRKLAFGGILLLGLMAMGTWGCSVNVGATATTEPSPGSFGPGDTMVQTNLYFGLSQKGGWSITPEQWARFVNTVITPRFPDGLTVVSGQGQWRNGSGQIVKENSMEVIIIHASTSDADKKIEEIRDLYKKQFAQESVLRTSEAVKVSF